MQGSGVESKSKPGSIVIKVKAASSESTEPALSGPQQQADLQACCAANEVEIRVKPQTTCAHHTVLRAAPASHRNVSCTSRMGKIFAAFVSQTNLEGTLLYL